MNANLLIDAIVRQTTILIAHLATATGTRSPLAHTANQIFADLVRELREQGLGNRIVADMFGLSLRTYHNRVRSMSESNTERGRTLWEAVLNFVQQKGTVLRGEDMLRFCRDDEMLVRGVLRDLVESGILYQSGVGDGVFYRVTDSDELQASNGSQSEVEAELIWVAIGRYGPVTAARLQKVVPISDQRIELAIEKLLGEERIQAKESQGERLYESEQCLIPMNASFGWEAAILDHYQAMVTAICAKLRKGLRRAKDGEAIGGRTYHFEVWEQHPLKREVLGFLQSTRERAQELRKRVEAYNKEHPAVDSSILKVFSYVGQMVIEPDENEREEE